VRTLSPATRQHHEDGHAGRETLIDDATRARFQPLGDRLLKPVHADYSFGNIPATVHYLLTGERLGPLLPVDCFGTQYPSPRRIVLFFIDAFGWEFWQRFAGTSRIMRRVMEDGRLTPISALFPSTTAASVTTMNLGVLPAAHAIFEWNMYVPAYGEVIQSLPFARLGGVPGSAADKQFDPHALFAVEASMHQALARHGVQSIQLAHRAYARSHYNSIASAGARIIAHGTLSEALVHLRDVLASTPDKAFISLYWASLDAIAHIHGPGTRFHDAEVIAFWRTLDALLEGIDAEDTLFLFTADHGHVRGVAEDTICINERWPAFRDWLAESPTGATIWPGGSPRDVFLHIRPEARAEALGVLRDGLREKALVMTVDDALAEGLFGGPVCPELRRRLGDILVLPYLGQFVWWREPGLIENKFNGHHGGLSAEEVISVLGVSHAL
jgi:hypothetical protein